MKEIEEYTAEVLRRAESKANDRKRKRRTALAVGAPLALLLCAAAIALPLVLGGKASGIDDKQADNSPVFTEQAADTDNVNETYAPDGTAEPTASPVDIPIVNTGTVDLMDGITPNSTGAAPSVNDESLEAYNDFALRVFRAAQNGENELISPMSLLCALSMAANGAEGETLLEMEQALGMTREELNDFWRGCCALMPSLEASRLEMANSIWFTSNDGFTVNKEFLQQNADIYKADIFKAPFDESTLRDINAWVNEKTEGMIPEILDEIPENVVMYLINALTFDAEWENKYADYSISSGDFRMADGSVRSVELMHGKVDGYLSDDNAEGFIKYYAGKRYAFAALLPDEGMSVEQYVASLTGEKLMSILGGVSPVETTAAIPKFEVKYSTELSELLISMGMKDAFDPDRADLSSLGGCESDGPLYVSRVLHKTFLSVDASGTRAGAVTAIQIPNDGGYPEHSITLDRPFVYMLIDCETNLPFFIGTLMEP